MKSIIRYESTHFLDKIEQESMNDNLLPINSHIKWNGQESWGMESETTH